MFGPLGVPEILFILVLALLIFGPRRLPDVGRTLGKAMGEFRRASTELKRSINTEIALEDEDERPRYTRSARPERGDGEGGEGRVAGEETVRSDEAPPRREDGEDLDLGQWTREGGGGGGGEEGGREGGGRKRSGGGTERGSEKAAPQPGTVPRGAAGPAGEVGDAGETGGESGPAREGGDPGDGSEGGGAGGDRGPGA